jgi:hypothetical protein
MPLYSLISPARGSRTLARKGPNNRTVERELEISRGGSKGFWQVNVDRLGNISENPNTVDGSETGKLPNWWIGRRTNCGLPGSNCIAPDRLRGSVAIC